MDYNKQKPAKNHKIIIIPRYSETDQAGVVHHSVYPIWFEMGRTELLRLNGTAYKDLEAAGIFFVVAQLNIKYLKPAKYDEKLELETTQSAISAVKIEHTYKLTRFPDKATLAEGSSVLACLNSDGKVQRIPDWFPSSNKSKK